jgi:CRP-like cAMP-binding protein
LSFLKTSMQAVFDKPLGPLNRAPQMPISTRVANGPLTDDEFALLAQSRSLRDLGTDFLFELVSLASVVRLAPGSSAMARGGPDAWFWVVKGVVRLSAQTVSGRRLVVGLLEPGQCFGVATGVGEPTSTHDAYASSHCTILCLKQIDRQTLLQRHPEFGAALARMCSEHAQRMEALLVDTLTMTLEGRLLGQLLLLANRFGVANGNAVRIPIKLSQQDIAEIVGISRQRANVTLKKLQRHGLVDWDIQGLVIPSLPHLRRVAAYTGART